MSSAFIIYSTATSSLDDATIARGLMRLARTGAYARPASEAEPGAYQVLSPRNDFAEPVAVIPEATMTAALALGWLSPAGNPGDLQLSRQGRRALKREISATTPTPASRATGASRSKPRTAATPAATARGPQRLEGPLLWLRNRKDRRGQPLITEAQYEAGTRFAADYIKGQMQPRTTASWSLTAPCLRKGTPGGGVDISDAALAARNRFHTAMVAVGPEMGQFLVEVCCHDIGLESAERARRWPIRSGKVVLDMGLKSLARHYGLEPTPKPAGDAAPSPRPRARRWADPAFKPTLAGWDADPAAAANRDADATACA